MCDLMRDDISKQRSQIHLKVLVQFLNSLEKHIAAAPTSVFAQESDTKN